MNQYPHQEEMEEVLDDLKEYVSVTHEPPFMIVEHFRKIVSELAVNDTGYSALSDLEEAAVLKNFGLWYQQEYAHKFSNGRERL